MVSIAADSSVSRAQNWQDSEGYHLVIPNTVAADSLKIIRGVKVRRVGTSLEVLLQTKPGSTVNVQAEGNEITLVVDRKLEAQPLEREARNDTTSSQEQQLFEDQKAARQLRGDAAPLTFSSPVDDLAANSQAPSQAPSGETAQTASNWNPPSGPTSALPAQAVPERDGSANPPAAEEVSVQVEDEGALASIFSATSVFVVIALGLFGLLVSRKLRSRQALAPTSENAFSEDTDWVENQTLEGKIRVQREAPEAGEALVKSGGAALANGSSRRSSVRS